MAPKGQYKVHSLSKHIEDTQKGLTADAQYNKRLGVKSATAIKKESSGIDKDIFGNNASDDSNSDDNSSSSGSDDEGGSDFLRKLASKSGKAPNATPKKRSQDDEIADSDDERKAAAKMKEAGSKAPPIKREESSEDGTSSESESESESKSKSEKSEKKVRADGAALKSEATLSITPTSTSASKSKDEENESDDSEDEGATKEKPAHIMANNDPSASVRSAQGDKGKKVPKAVATSQSVSKVTNGHATSSTSDTSSGEEEDSDDEEEKENAAPAKSSNKNAKQSSPTQSSDESASEASEASDASDADDADESMHITDRKRDSRVALPNFVARDFVLRKSDDGAKGQDVARVCNEANLQGKQVWYFTVPANVPISVVQNMEIPMNQSNRDDRVFSHDGEDYGISFDSMVPKSSIQILIPSADKVQYQPTPRQINQVMHVKKVAQLGRGNLQALSSGPAPKDPRRAQPKGMKLRYQPFGVNTPMGQIGGNDEDSGSEADVDMTDAPALAIPSTSASSKAEKKEKKQKQKQKNQDADTAARKGKRKLSSEDDAVAAAEQLMEENQSAKAQSKKQKTHRGASPDLGSDEKSSSSSSTKKVTLILPPEVPSSQRAASTPVSKLKNKNVKVETPVSAPRQSVVPLPVVPGSSQLPKVSPVPVPLPMGISSPLVSKDSKKAKVKREKTEKPAAATIKQSPPPSAQGNKRSTNKMTPVPAPKLKSAN
ncbi:hypothetical protein E4U55_004648 [Claviceps digitariae]|nr:hypothetical protein E4U55_004648 [Claviceps digitariae]